MAARLEIRKLLAFGAGCGIVIRGGDLDVTVARVRPSGITVLGRLAIRDFRSRRAAEWGAEYAAFLKKLGVSYLSATVVLPRAEVIVRQIAFPGVSGRDLEAAIALQLDTLHPYGEDDVQYGWTAVGNSSVVVGILRRSTLESYLGLFSEAGIAVESFTFPAGAIHAALRLMSPPATDGFVAMHGLGQEPVELYGESPGRPIFSAEFDVPVEQAVALAVGELRLDPASAAVPLANLLPMPRSNPVENDISRDALPYAAALAGACPRLARAANLLPGDRRVTRSRAMFVPSIALGALVLLLAGALMAYSKIEERQYLKKLAAEIARVEPVAGRGQALDRRAASARAQSVLLDEFRARAKDDLATLNELTRLLPPPVWTGLIELNRDSVNINGEAEQAAPLLGVLDGSPYFRNSEFAMNTRGGIGEVFRIHTVRRAVSNADKRR